MRISLCRTLCAVALSAVLDHGHLRIALQPHSALLVKLPLSQ